MADSLINQTYIKNLRLSVFAFVDEVCFCLFVLFLFIYCLLACLFALLLVSSFFCLFLSSTVYLPVSLLFFIYLLSACLLVCFSACLLVRLSDFSYLLPAILSVTIFPSTCYLPSCLISCLSV